MSNVLTIDTTFYILNISQPLCSAHLSLCRTYPNPPLRIITHKQPNLLLSTTYSSPTHYISIHRVRDQKPNRLSPNPNMSQLFSFFYPTFYDPGGSRWPPTLSNYLNFFFGNLLFLVVFQFLNFRGHFEGLNDAFSQSGTSRITKVFD